MKEGLFFSMLFGELFEGGKLMGWGVGRVDRRVREGRVERRA